MRHEFSHLDGTATLMYSETLDRSLVKDTAKGTGFSFNLKNVRGNKYWYLQHTLGGSRKQYYLGEGSPDIREKMVLQKARWAESKPDQEAIEKLVSMAIRGGCMPISHRAYKVLSAIEQAGLFRAGGVLVGSYAFQAMGNMLGVSWTRDSMLTQDIDLASSSECMVAIPEGVQPICDIILGAEDGMLKVPMLNQKAPSTSFKVRGDSFRVDLITPLHGRANKSSVYIDSIKSFATPLRFLDYVLEDTQKAILLHKDGVVANVPTPSRFALHKLIVAERRPASESTKASKDREQAAQLIDCLLETRPGDLWLALDAAKKYPSAKFLHQLRTGLEKLPVEISQPLIKYMDNNRVDLTTESVADFEKRLGEDDALLLGVEPSNESGKNIAP